jgi:hypothetical protein
LVWRDDRGLTRAERGRHQDCESERGG